MKERPRLAFQHVGATLRDAREHRGCTLSEIATATNISIHMLEAIERGDLAHVPGGIFGRAHLRAYAIHVGANPEDIVREYREQREDADNTLRDLRVRCANRGVRRSASWIRPALVVAAVLTLIIYRVFFAGPAELPLVDPARMSVPAADEPHPRTDVPVARLNDRVTPHIGASSGARAAY